MIKYSILVNTCDKFEDCWEPFFKLFKLYWPECNGAIYLNTEYKDYSYPGLNIIPVKGCAKHHVPRDKRATWSQCLKWALEEMDTGVVLYMQEDYFLTGKVDNEMLEHFIEIMDKEQSIPCIQLTSEGIPMGDKTTIEHLYHGNKQHFSYLSCQASLWRKSVLKSLIREHETAWNFEWWGSKRARYMGLDFLTVDHRWVHQGGYQIIPYIFTGVIGGKWYKPVVELFDKHHIQMDYSHRGFYNPDLKPTLRKRVQTKLSIWRWRSMVEIMKLKYLH